MERIDPELASLMGEEPPRISQAERVIKKMGGPRAVANAIDISREQVYRWTYPKERGGTGGIIPQKPLKKIIRHARQQGVVLTPYDLDPRETTA